MHNHHFHLFITLLVVVAGVDVNGTTASPKPGSAASLQTAATPTSHLCVRQLPGGPLSDAPRITSVLDFAKKERILNTTLTYYQESNEAGNELSCFIGPQGQFSPTFVVRAKDRIIITLVNNAPPGSNAMTMFTRVCGSKTIDSSSVNLHFHGMSISPKCGQDDIFAVDGAGQSLIYDFRIPHHSTPGVFPYHFHIHGFSEAAMLGGASGLFLVEGVENIHPQLAGLPDRLVTVRDHTVALTDNEDDAPSWDLDVNFSPVDWPNYTAPVLTVRPGETQYVRLSANVADSSINVQYVVDDEAQLLHVFSLDAYPVANPFNTTSIDMGPYARVEFTITSPAQPNQTAKLITTAVETGPDGDSNPARPLLHIQIDSNASAPAQVIPQPTAISKALIFNDLPDQPINRTRKIYFSEIVSDPSDPDSPTDFFITQEGAKPALFDPDAPPAIVTTVGSVEDWIIENRARERHVFHIHQGHFLLLEKDGVPVPADESQYLDTLPVDFWSGKEGDPYPSKKFRIDFRQVTEGDYPFHCHYMGHEDGGMMAILRVVNRTSYVSSYASSLTSSIWSPALISSTTVAVVACAALLCVLIAVAVFACRTRARKTQAYSTPMTSTRRESAPSTIEPVPFHLHNTDDRV